MYNFTEDNDLNREKVKSLKDIIKRLFKFVKPYLPKLIFIMGIVILTTLVNQFPQLMSEKIFKVADNNALSREYKIKYVSIIVSILGGISVFGFILLHIRTIAMQKIGQNIVLKLRRETFDHIQTLDDNQLNQIPTGTLVTRVTNNTEDLNEMYTQVFLYLVTNALSLIIIFIILFIKNWELSLYMLIVFVITGIFTWLFRTQTHMAFRQTKSKLSHLNAFLSENLSGMEITQIFNQQEKKKKEFKRISRELKNSYMKEIILFGIFRPMIFFLSSLSYVFILWYGIRMVQKGIIDQYAMQVYYLFVSMSFGPIQWLSDQYVVISSAFASAEKVFNINDLKPQIIDSPNSIELTNFKGNIEFKNVWFYYKPGEWVLKDVSFKVSPNEKVAFVGATGSGKTTILGLIVRNYEVQQGEILIDGINIKNITKSSLRRQIGQMLQDVFLFNDTIKNNITLYNENVSFEDVVKACKYVGADTFINNLKDGYDHMVLERGNNLSAGQRQLLSFARAICYKPNLMILDEATANIDSETEQLIQKSLKKMMNANTMIVVAHRLSTIQHSDKIIVINKGEIIEQGNHKQLLKKKGIYYNLYKTQYTGKDEIY